MRPLYETADDRRRESSVMRALSRVFVGRVRWVKMPAKSRYDYEGICRLGSRICVEIKCRKDWSYPTYMISATKLRILCALAQKNRVFIALSLDGRIMYHKVGRWIMYAKYLAVGGRVDRGDPMDMEVCAYIPMHLFREPAI